jgi:hypothetical protein
MATTSYEPTTNIAFEDWYALEGWKYLANKKIALRVWKSLRSA